MCTPSILIILDEIYGMIEVAQRSIFVVDTDGKVTYKWIRENGNPDFQDLVTETRDAVAEATHS